jgi:YARHG domain
MSRQTLVILSVFLAALVAGNILVLAIWLPSRKNVAATPESSNAKPVAGQSAAPATANSGLQSTTATGDLVLERQISSGSGNLRVNYLRDRKSKVRRISVEDMRRPGDVAVLCESKQPIWAVISPDDQWIAVDERNPTDGGGARLYHHSGNSSVQYVIADGNEASTLQEKAWQSYLNASHADPNTPRHGVTIDATGWENDSRRLDVSVAFLPAPDNPDVPEPWRCTYDVISKQVESTADQPPVEANLANASANDEERNQLDNAPNSEAESAEDNEFPGEKFPATRSDELTVPDVNESSLSDITYAINEMFARHGAEFKDRKVTKEFAQFSWYKPRPGLTFDDIESEFSEVEKANMKILGRCRDAKLAANRRKSQPVRGQNVEEESTSEKVRRGFQMWQDLGAPIPPHP